MTKIKFLEEAIEIFVKTNIEEILAVVASSIESKNESDNKNVQVAKHNII